MLPALTALLLAQLLGEVLVRTLGLPVPGPVLGLLCVLLALGVWPRLVAALKPTAQSLLAHLSLLFVPAGVGVMLHLRRLGDEALAIGVALVVSTLVGLGVTALTMAALMRWQARRRAARRGPL
jgi:holin-like protein